MTVNLPSRHPAPRVLALAVVSASACGALASPTDPFAGLSFAEDAWTDTVVCDTVAAHSEIRQMLLVPRLDDRQEIAFVIEVPTTPNTPRRTFLGHFDLAAGGCSTVAPAASTRSLELAPGAVIGADPSAASAFLELGGENDAPTVAAAVVSRFNVDFDVNVGVDPSTRREIARLAVPVNNPSLVPLGNGELLILGRPKNQATRGWTRFAPASFTASCDTATQCPSISIATLPPGLAPTLTLRRPRAFLLPDDYDGGSALWLLGDAGQPLIASTSLQVIRPSLAALVADASPDPFANASAAMLPLRSGMAGEPPRARFLVVSGSEVHAAYAEDAHPLREIALLQTSDLDHSPLLILLPDGSVAVLHGARRAAYLDSRHDLARTWGQDRIPAGSGEGEAFADTAAVLLADGSVLVAVARAAGGVVLQRLAPPYMAKPRPALHLDASEQILTYGQPFGPPANGKKSTEVVLMAISPSVDGQNLGQRSIVLQPSSDGRTLAPSNGCVAPPGWYLLFVVNDARVPSEGVPVQLVGTGLASDRCAM